ncbi:hypothetical protein JHK82_016409 [Glycine max]|nr:hypothetical protein JHK85_016824 [Glycine max]KAG5149528.1 hypothetical protein JHK82_016409 [Glycine max]
MALDSNRADTSSNANATKDDASDEDLASKQQLELYVERVQDPDQGLQNNSSTAIDIWSLGCIMVELLSKESLFNGKTEFEQLDKANKKNIKESRSIRRATLEGDVAWRIRDWWNLPLSHCRRQRWAGKSYKNSHLGNEWKKLFAGSSHAKGIVLEKIGIEAKQPNFAIDKCARVQLIKNWKKIAAFFPNDGFLNYIEANFL